MITTIAGSNDFLKSAELNKRIEKFLKDNDQFGLERIDGDEASMERIKEALLGQGLFASQKLVIVRQAEAAKELLENIEQLFSAVPESTDVIFVFSKLDKRAKYAKFLKSESEFLELNQPDARQLASWLVNEAKERSGNISQANAQLLVDRLGPNQAVLSQELDKLMLYSPEITKDMILQQTDATPQSTVFELMDAAFGGNKKKALTIYKEQRELKVEPLAILGMIAWQLHILLIVATAKGKAPADIAKDAKVHPFVVQKSSRITSKLSLAELKDLAARALDLDIRLKTQSINADDALQHLLLSI